MKDKTIKLFKKYKNYFIMAGIILLFIIIISLMLCNKRKIGNTWGNLMNLGFSVESDGWIYFLGTEDGKTDGIYKIKANSNKTKKISSDYGLYFNKYESDIFYLDMTEDNNNIVKINKNGENKEIVIGDVDNAKISIIDNWIYYFKDNKLYKARTEGTEKQILIDRTIGNYVVLDNWIYYSYKNDGKTTIAKIKCNGKDNIVIDNDASEDFFIKNNRVYYIYQDNKNKIYELYSIKTNGQDKKKLKSIGKEIEGINFDGNSIYYIKTDDEHISSIYSIKINDGNEEKIIELKDYTTLINIQKGWLYYIDQNEKGNSQIFRIKINGENKEEV